MEFRGGMGLEEFKNSRGFKDSRGFKNSRIQEFKNSRIQEFKRRLRCRLGQIIFSFARFYKFRAHLKDFLNLESS